MENGDGVKHIKGPNGERFLPIVDDGKARGAWELGKQVPDKPSDAFQKIQRSEPPRPNGLDQSQKITPIKKS